MHVTLHFLILPIAYFLAISVQSFYYSSIPTVYHIQFRQKLQWRITHCRNCFPLVEGLSSTWPYVSIRLVDGSYKWLPSGEIFDTADASHARTNKFQYTPDDECATMSSGYGFILQASDCSISRHTFCFARVSSC